MVNVFSHIRTGYFSEASVQQHPPPYSFRKRVLVRPVMKRLFFPWKTKEEKARFARAPHDKLAFTGPTICTSYSFFVLILKNLGFSRACWRSLGITSYGCYLPQAPIVFASSSIDKHGSQLSTTGIRQQTAAAPTSQEQHSKSTRVYVTPGNSVANPASPRAPLASQRLRE